MRRIILLVLVIFCASLAWSQELLRFPALSPDASEIAFSYQGDIWIVPTQGGEARRLTIHQSYATRPQWSPNGETILFEGRRYNNTDLFTISRRGDQLQRHTHYSSGDFYAKWEADGTVLFNTNRAFKQVERESEIYQLDGNGGTPFRSMDALGYMPTPSPDGRYVVFARGSCRIEREAYNGPANKDLWLFDRKTRKFTQLTTHDGQDIYPEWGDANTVYFLSARTGRYNIYKLTIRNGVAGNPPVALTNFKDEGIRYFDVSGNGQLAILEKGNQILTMKLEKGSRPTAVKIDVTKDNRFDPMERKTYSNNADEMALSPNGKYIAFAVRGEVYIYPADKDKKRARQITKSPFRDQSVEWLNDTTLVFLSDRNGNYDIFMARSGDAEEPNLYKTLKLNIQPVTNTPAEEGSLMLSPERDKIAFRRDRGQLVVAAISPEGQLTEEKLLHDSWSTPAGISWSPDGKWLAYNVEDLNFNEEVYVHAADNSQPPINVSLHPRRDYGAVWSEDGSKLGFLSDRNNGDADVWFVWLAKEDWEKTQRDWEEDEDEEKSKKDTTDTGITIDFENIHNRLEQVTRLPGSESNLAISKDGETFYFSTNRGGRQGSEGKRSFRKVKWDGTEDKVLLPNKSIRGLAWDKKGKNILVLDTRGSIAKMNAESGKLENLPYQAKMIIDHATERQQVFDEAWRALNLGFYDPNFHGRDFAALRKKYEPLALSASTSQDFRDIFNEMLGQLDASHMGMYGPNPEQTQREQTGLLGIEVVPDSRGVRVTSIIPDGPADRTSSKLEEGEVIIAINGVALTGNVNMYKYLEGTANERTLLEVLGRDGQLREVVIRPARFLNTQQYEAWVAERKRLVEEYSDGQLGYIHIRGMNWSSFERFERELTASGLGKRGMVIDVRFNGGGWTTDMLMAVLNVRQHSYTIPRGAAASLEKEHTKFSDNYPFGERLPFPALTMPSIALCNQNSYSNAEIFSHAYKTLGHGTLVGTPTFGAVISTGGQRLIDGSRVRMPFRAWYVKATGENMEHGPAVPDIILDNAPDSKAKGQDPQLKKAVNTLLKQIARR
ncbi:MAG: S41 family peptidase [Bacteroidota bacterium]